jgi:hypothetical protein
MGRFGRGNADDTWMRRLKFNALTNRPMNVDRDQKLTMKCDGRILVIVTVHNSLLVLQIGRAQVTKNSYIVPSLLYK